MTVSPSIETASRRLGLDQAALLHGLRLALAAWLAFAIASFLHVGNAYWAAMPIWVVSQSAKGLLIERAIFRLVGTLVGAGVGFALLHLVENPYVVLVLLSGWVVLAATLVHLLRGVQAYGALLAGMTAAVVVLPSILQPDHSIALAVARVECTLIGVVLVTLVTGLWTPPSPRLDFYGRVRQLSREAVVFAGTILDGLPEADADARERGILRALSDVQASASFVTAGSLAGYRRRHHVHALVVASMAVMAAARARDDRQRRRRDLPAVAPADILAMAAELGVADPAVPRQAGADRLARIATGDVRLGAALTRLVEAEALFDMDRRAAAGAADKALSFAGKAATFAFDRDGRLALERGLIAGAATLVASVLGYRSGWGAGSLAALGVCIFSMVLGSLPRPQQVAPVMLKGVSAGVAAALLYRFLVQPHVASVPQLIVSIAPFILVGALARVSSRTAGPALDANMCFMLASQAVLPAVSDPVAILSGAAALMLAAVLVAPGFMLLPPLGGSGAARATKAIRDDLLLMAARPGPIDAKHRPARAARQILRLSLHVERASEGGRPSAGSLLSVLNLGEAIVTIQALIADPDCDSASRETLSSGLSALRRIGNEPMTVAAFLDELAGPPIGAAAAEALNAAAAALKASGTLLAETRPP